MLFVRKIDKRKFFAKTLVSAFVLFITFHFVFVSYHKSKEWIEKQIASFSCFFFIFFDFHTIYSIAFLSLFLYTHLTACLLFLIIVLFFHINSMFFVRGQFMNYSVINYYFFFCKCFHFIKLLMRIYWSCYLLQSLHVAFNWFHRTHSFQILISALIRFLNQFIYTLENYVIVFP